MNLLLRTLAAFGAALTMYAPVLPAQGTDRTGAPFPIVEGAVAIANYTGARVIARYTDALGIARTDTVGVEGVRVYTTGEKVRFHIQCLDGYEKPSGLLNSAITGAKGTLGVKKGATLVAGCEYKVRLPREAKRLVGLYQDFIRKPPMPVLRALLLQLETVYRLYGESMGSLYDNYARHKALKRDDLLKADSIFRSLPQDSIDAIGGRARPAAPIRMPGIGPIT